MAKADGASSTAATEGEAAASPQANEDKSPSTAAIPKKDDVKMEEVEDVKEKFRDISPSKLAEHLMEDSSYAMQEPSWEWEQMIRPFLRPQCYLRHFSFNDWKNEKGNLYSILALLYK